MYTEGLGKREQIWQNVSESRYKNIHCTILIYCMFNNFEKPLDKQFKVCIYKCVCVCVCVCVRERERERERLQGLNTTLEKEKHKSDKDRREALQGEEVAGAEDCG